MVSRHKVLRDLIDSRKEVHTAVVAVQEGFSSKYVKKLTEELLIPRNNDGAFQPSINLKVGDIIKPTHRFQMLFSDVGLKTISPEQHYMLVDCDNGVTYPTMSNNQALVRTVWVSYSNIQPYQGFDIRNITDVMYLNTLYLVAWLCEGCRYVCNMDLTREYKHNSLEK